MSCLPSLPGRVHLAILVTAQLNINCCAGSPLDPITSFCLCNMYGVDLTLNVVCNRLCNNLMHMLTGTACTLCYFLLKSL